jgi:hypothetical protein
MSAVTSVDQDDRDLKLGAELCAEAGAHLSVLVVALAAPPPVGDYAATLSDAWLEERQADIARLKRRTETVTSFLASNDISADVASEYAEIASADDAISRRGRYADLMIIGPNLLDGETLKSKTLEGALFLSGKPVFLVPRARAALKPRSVLVAWDSRVEASRAVRESLKVLAGAEEVHLVLVDPEEGKHAHGAESGADAAHYLARHGVKVTVDRLPIPVTGSRKCCTAMSSTWLRGASSAASLAQCLMSHPCRSLWCVDRSASPSAKSSTGSIQLFLRRFRQPRDGPVPTFARAPSCGVRRSPAAPPGRRRPKVAGS